MILLMFDLGKGVNPLSTRVKSRQHWLSFDRVIVPEGGG
jgi:hypothetical protein